MAPRSSRGRGRDDDKAQENGGTGRAPLALNRAIEPQHGFARCKEAWRKMGDDNFNMSLRRFLKHVGVTSQSEIERLVREDGLVGGGPLKVRMTLTAEGTELRHVVDGEIDLRTES